MRALLIAAIACSATSVVAQPTTTTPTTTAPTTTATTTAPSTTPAEEERPLIWSTPTPWVTIAVGGAAALGSLAVLTWVPLPTGNEGAGVVTLAAPFIVTSGAVVGTRLLLPEPTPLNVTLPAVGASLGLATGFVAASIFSSTVIPEHTTEGSGFRKNASLAAFAVGVAGGAAVGTALGVLVADVIE